MYKTFLILIPTTKKVSHIEVEQELVTLPTVKAAAPSDAQPLQLLLVPTTSSAAAASGTNSGGGTRLGRIRGSNPPAETRLMNAPLKNKEIGLEPIAAKSGSVSVGVAVQVPTSSYVPAKPPQRRPQPPPIPPRNIRLTVNYPSETGGSYKSMQRPYREPPLLEESDSTDNNKAVEMQQQHQKQQQRTIQAKMGVRVSSSSQDEDSDAENSRSGMLACVSNANDTSIESLVLEETTLLLPATSTGRSLMRNITEKDEDTLI